MRERARVRRARASAAAPAGRVRRDLDPVLDVRAAEAQVRSRMRVGAANDPRERDADAVADEVLRRLGVGDRRAAPGEGRVQRGAEVGAAGGALHPGTAGEIEHARRSGGHRLRRDLRRDMEAATGADLRDVRVHDGAEAADLAQRLSAKAFTTGKDVFLGHGVKADRRILAHEVAHAAESDGDTTVRRVLGTTTVGAVKESGNPFEEGTDEAIPNEFIELADAIQGLKNSVDAGLGNDADPTFTTDSVGASAGHGTFGALGGLKKMGSGAYLGVEGVRNLVKGHKEDDTLFTNFGAQQLETGITTFASGGGLATAGLAKAGQAGAEQLPVFEAVSNFIEAGVKGKKSVEDSVAAEKLRHQGRKAKHETDHYLPLDVRMARLDAFLTDYEALQQAKRDAQTAAGFKAKASAELRVKKLEMGFKSGDVKRYEKAKASFGGDPVADKAGFLAHLQANDIKEFGKGTEARTAFQEEVKAKTKTASKDYEESRSLEKVASFGHRRKAETATLNAIEATGHALDGAGSFTAGADFGATKVAGKSLKAGSALYKGVKGIAKRAKRVHDLRTAKNETAYGGEANRGIGWGMKQFFGGNVEQSQKRVRKAIKDGAATTFKADGSVDTKGVQVGHMSEEQKQALIKRLTMQAIRRVDDLVRCLGSDNPKICNRAKQILHVIAETNLAGALAKIDDADIDRFRDLQRKVKDGTATPTERTAYKKRKGIIRDMFRAQLGGVGG